MRTVTVITGNPGVGKSTVAKMLMNAVPESGWYDCDLPWKTNPAFGPGRLKERMIGVATMSAAAADTYFEAGLQHAIISGVLPGDLHFQSIRSRMKQKEIRFNAFWLACDEKKNRERLIGRDGHDDTFVDLSGYLGVSQARKVDCSSDSARDVVQNILGLLDMKGGR